MSNILLLKIEIRPSKKQSRKKSVYHIEFRYKVFIERGPEEQYFAPRYPNGPIEKVIQNMIYQTWLWYEVFTKHGPKDLIFCF